MRYSKPQVFLSGPVEQVDDATTWRRKVKKSDDRFAFVDPTELIWERGKNDDKMVDKCEMLVEESDALLIRYMEGQNTCGTWHEQQIAWRNNLTVVLVTDVPEDELFTFASRFAHHVTDNVTRGLELIHKRV